MPALTATLPFLVGTIAAREEEALAHALAELLVRVPVGDFGAGIHQRSIARHRIHGFTKTRVRRKQMDLLATRALRQQYDLFVAIGIAGTDRHLPGGAKKTPHVRMHECHSRTTAGNSERDWL